MPLTRLQQRILSVIARHRDAESFVAGGTVIQRDGIRRTRDIDIFHDRADRPAERAALRGHVDLDGHRGSIAEPFAGASFGRTGGRTTKPRARGRSSTPSGLPVSGSTT